MDERFTGERDTVVGVAAEHIRDGWGDVFAALCQPQACESITFNYLYDWFLGQHEHQTQIVEMRSRAKIGKRLIGDRRPTATGRREAKAIWSLFWRLDYAPRYRHHIMRELKQMCHEAWDSEIIPLNPFSHLKISGWDVDADLEWRDQAVYDAPEVAELVFGPLPLARRVRYAILLTTGMRSLELRKLLMRHVEKEWIRLTAGVKVKVAKNAPIHLAIRPLLEEWREEGYRKFTGRDWSPEDFACPSLTRWGRLPRQVGKKQILTDLQSDLETLNLRKRTIQCMRRTLVTLLADAGADRRTTNLITHKKPSDVQGRYEIARPHQVAREAAKFPLLLPLANAV